MYECSKCGKEFKSEKGLKIHDSKCIVETQIEAVEEENTVEVSDSIQRKINKLIDAKNSCYDAEYKYKLEQEIKQLKGQ